MGVVDGRQLNLLRLDSITGRCDYLLNLYPLIMCHKFCDVSKEIRFPGKKSIFFFRKINESKKNRNPASTAKIFLILTHFCKFLKCHLAIVSKILNIHQKPAQSSTFCVHASHGLPLKQLRMNFGTN